MLNIHKRLPLALALVAGLAGAQLPAEAATYSYRQPAVGLVAPAVATPPVPAPASCSLPWGGSLASGGSVSAYPLATVAAPGSCVAEMLTCANGVLSNPTAVQSCTVTDPDWAGVSAQLEFDGDVVDARGATVTKVGVATPATSSSVFMVGTGALDLSTGGYVTLPVVRFPLIPKLNSEILSAKVQRCSGKCDIASRAQVQRASSNLKHRAAGCRGGNSNFCNRRSPGVHDISVKFKLSGNSSPIRVCNRAGLNSSRI
jgi:hypothetical protein